MPFIVSYSRSTYRTIKGDRAEDTAINGGFETSDDALIVKNSSYGAPFF